MKKSEIPLSSLASLSSGGFMLRAAGVERDFPYNSHRDDYYLFGVTIKGQHRVGVDFREITIDEQQALIIAPGQVHEIMDGDSNSGFIIAFSPECLKENEIQLLDNYSLNTRPIPLDSTDYDDIISLYKMLVRRGGNYTEVEYSIAVTIKSIILKHIQIENDSTPNRYLRLTAELRNLLKDNIAREKSPSAYASMMNISGVYLNEAVKCATGISAENYIISFAMLLAKREMVYTELSIQEIAFGLGYEDYSYFSRLFRKYAGVSPREFRSKYLK